MTQQETGIHRGQRRGMFEGGSLVIAKVGEEEGVRINCHGHNLGDVCELRLTATEAHGLARLIEDTLARNGCTVMGIKTGPVSGFTRALQAI